jgi:PAS domain-containing protein
VDEKLPAGQARDVILESLAGRVLDSLPVAICAFDLEGTLLGFNQPWLEIMRKHFPDVPAEKYRPGVKIFDVLPPNQLRVRRDEVQERYFFGH